MVVWGSRYVYIYIVFSFPSWEPPWSTWKPLGAPVAAATSRSWAPQLVRAHGGGCEVWWKNHEDGTTNGVFPWMVGGKVIYPCQSCNYSRWWQLKYFLFSSLPGEGFHFDKHFWDGLKPPTSKSWNFWHLYFCFRQLVRCLYKGVIRFAYCIHLYTHYDLMYNLYCICNLSIHFEEFEGIIYITKNGGGPPHTYKPLCQAWSRPK